MAKNDQSIRRAKRAAAFQRRITRGSAKAARKAARRTLTAARWF